MDEANELVMYRKVLANLRLRREKVDSGKTNSIPTPFNRFRETFPGIEQGKYYLITANQKVGKSKMVDFLFTYEPFFYYMENKGDIDLKILYFTLEMSKESKYEEFMCHLLYRLSGRRIRISPVELRSTDSNKPVPLEVLDILETEEYKEYFKEFERCVEYIDDIKNPTGINKYCREFALRPEIGILHTKDRVTNHPIGGEEVEKVASHYESIDPDLYKIIIIDNAANLVQESGMNLQETITKMSKYNVTLRNQLNFTPVLVQHQAQAQEGLDNIKMGLMKPSGAGLADCKTTIRDVDTALGIYHPFKYQMDSFLGYNTYELGNYARFMEVMESRSGSNGICAMFFDGATSTWDELPSLKTDAMSMDMYYKLAKSFASSI